MKLKNLILSSVVAGSALLAAGTANSATIWGQVVQVYSAPGGVTYAYIRPSNWFVGLGAGQYVWYVRTVNANWGDRLSSHLYDNVYIVTTPACNGAVPYNYCGDVNYFYAN